MFIRYILIFSALNEKIEPLPGVTIIAFSTATTTSDIDGNFSFNFSPDKKYELIFSAVGYATEIITMLKLLM
jgi:hypothetical protein